MMNLGNHEKPDKPTASSGFSAEMKQVCSYQHGDQNLTFGKDIWRLRPQYCSSSTIRIYGIMIKQFHIGRFKFLDKEKWQTNICYNKHITTNSLHTTSDLLQKLPMHTDKLKSAMHCSTSVAKGISSADTFCTHHTGHRITLCNIYLLETSQLSLQLFIVKL